VVESTVDEEVEDFGVAVGIKEVAVGNDEVGDVVFGDGALVVKFEYLGGVGGEHGEGVGLGEASFDGGVEVVPEVFAFAEFGGGQGDGEPGVGEPASVGGGAFVVLEGGEGYGVGGTDGEDIGGFGKGERDDHWMTHIFEG